jgi:hypothetical protein
MSNLRRFLNQNLFQINIFKGGACHLEALPGKAEAYGVGYPGGVLGHPQSQATCAVATAETAVRPFQG